MTSIDTGLDHNQRRAITESLSAVLADTAALYQKTHAYHWNVTGPHFPALHALFEAQYREMWAALDEIAERIRALGEVAPQNGKTIAQLAGLDAAEDAPPVADVMVRNLLAGHEALVRRARRALEIVGEAGDAATEDLLTVRIEAHEKTAWMLRATAA
jgi:starvation-inducible DNA-binding protein